MLETLIVTRTTLTPTRKNDRKFENVSLHCATCGNKKYYGANAANRPIPWKSKLAGQNRPQVQDEQNNITENVQAGAHFLN